MTTAQRVDAHPDVRTRSDNLKLALAALGVVYGDIGTSPLYTIKECFKDDAGIAVRPESVYGLLSLVFWAVTLVVCVKYLTFVLRADNQGDGGLMALIALVEPHARGAVAGRHLGARGTAALVTLGLFATALLFCDGIITPAISVLGAIEGLTVVTSAFEHWVVPLTCVILAGVFLVQSHGTGEIGRVFGPAMLLWFVTIAVLGVPAIAEHPEILQAINPIHAFRFFLNEGSDAFFVLGSVVLCITGAEALYADMGHFGKGPIRIAWYAVAYPALLLNYFGQSALVLTEGDRVIENPFFHLAPRWFLIPLLVIATSAAIIASQAMISGAFAMAQQAVRLGYLPRLRIEHTSSQIRGQVYVPLINGALAVGCLSLVLAFRSSAGLAAAYGVAVVGAMATTSLLLAVVVRRRFRWPVAAAGGLSLLFLSIEVPFLSANLAKLFHGAWVPIVLGLVLGLLMATWKRGRQWLFGQQPELPIELFLEDLKGRDVPRVEGTAVFMTAQPAGTPRVLLHFFKHLKMLHKRVVLLTFEVSPTPRVKLDERLKVDNLGQGVFRVIARHGFMETLTVPRVFELLRAQGLSVEIESASFFLGRESLAVTKRKEPFSRFRKHIFELMSRNAYAATHYYEMPPNRVVELGVRLEI